MRRSSGRPGTSLEVEVDAGAAHHVRYLVRLRERGGDAVHDEGLRETRRGEQRRFGMHVGVDEPGKHEGSLSIDDPLRFAWDTGLPRR